MFLTSIFTQVAQIGVQTGYAKFDSSSIIKVLRGMAGLPTPKTENEETKR